VIEEGRYAEIARFLPPNALMVFNNTRVVEARFLFQKDSGGVIEVFILEPHSVLHQVGQARCKCLIGGASKWKHGMLLQRQGLVRNENIELQAAITNRHADNFEIEFSWQPSVIPFGDIVKAFGVMPIPPYLKRDADGSDDERYQTIYARHNGSVAAPTAGLHFTDRVFQSLREKNIAADFVTLHVGAGTFMPVKSELMRGHDMHAEFINVEQAFVRKLLVNTNAIFAVGTTALRTLESIYWMGLKCYLNPNISIEELEVKQWEVYDHLMPGAIATNEALESLLQWMVSQGLQDFYIRTRILIAPGYQPKVINGLVTNFHQPGSTLLLLVAAVIGENWRKIYNHALENDFRFLSYGDGCLLFVD
jgi:S-adenosylmethionine:tRNA ribosyltransferase-isomerase